MNFYISSKDLKEISNETAKNWFGQSIVHDWEKKINPIINFFVKLFNKSDFSSIKVKAINLEKLLQNEKNKLNRYDK